MDIRQFRLADEAPVIALWERCDLVRPWNDPAARRRGFGRRLMSEIEQRLAATGCPTINLQIRNGNSGAMTFYAALGYATDDVVSMGKRMEVDQVPAVSEETG